MTNTGADYCGVCGAYWECEHRQITGVTAAEFSIDFDVQWNTDIYAQWLDAIDPYDLVNYREPFEPDGVTPPDAAKARVLHITSDRVYWPRAPPVV